jgi:predicted deacylase
MAVAFGLPYIIISTDRPKDPNASRYLENSATTRGKASITAEAGRSGPVDVNDAAILSRGVRNVMAHLKMTTMSATPVDQPIWIERLVSVTAEQDGMFHPAVQRDAHVAKGSRIGAVRDYWNRPVAEFVAPEDGVVLFIRAVPSLKKGDTIASLGVVKK